MALWDGVNEENQRRHQQRMKRYRLERKMYPHSKIPVPKPPRHVAPYRPKKQTYVAEPLYDRGGGGRVSRGGGGGGGAQTYHDPYAAERAAAAAAAAKAEAERKAREERENADTNRQVDALKRMIDTEFAKRRDGRLANIQRLAEQQDALILQDYEARLVPLKKMREDNEKSEHDSSFQNLANRARERGDILDAALAQGVGETDLARAQMIAARNWAANQMQTNRAFFDTESSINKSQTDLQRDTRTARMNVESQANADRREAWSSYWSQVADTWTQIGNVESANKNESFKARHTDAYSKAAEATGQTYSDPGISQRLRSWTGAPIQDSHLNTSEERLTRPSTLGRERRPEGSSLRRWA